MLTIKNLPLYWRFTEVPSEHPKIPSVLDFTFDIDDKLGMIIEKKTSQLLTVLDEIYKADANIGYMIDGHNLSASYGKDYINFLKSIFGDFSNKRVVDVGCGGCTLLEHLKKQGANVLGVDPSPVALRAAKKKGISLINDFFSPGLIEDVSADAILQMDVFEHIYDPVKLLSAEKQALKEDGFIIINVPNCEYSVSQGDISMAIPQHVNMYTKYSLCKLVEAAGLYVAKLETSGYGSALYCAATKNKNKATCWAEDFKHEREWVTSFFEKAQKRISRFENFLYTLNNPESVGYFIFQRSLPYTCAIGFSIDKARFFDNNALWKGKYLDGVPGKVENIDDFIQNPPPETIIMSNTFGSEIKNEILKTDDNLSVFLQEDIFNGKFTG